MTGQVTNFGHKIYKIEYLNAYQERLLQSVFECFRKTFPNEERLNEFIKWVPLCSVDAAGITEPQMHIVRRLINDIMKDCPMGVPLGNDRKYISDEFKILDLGEHIHKNVEKLGKDGPVILKMHQCWKERNQQVNPMTADFISWLRESPSRECLVAPLVQILV